MMTKEKAGHFMELVNVGMTEKEVQSRRVLDRQTLAKKSDWTGFHLPEQGFYFYDYFMLSNLDCESVFQFHIGIASSAGRGGHQATTQREDGGVEFGIRYILVGGVGIVHLDMDGLMLGLFSVLVDGGRWRRRRGAPDRTSGGGMKRTFVG